MKRLAILISLALLAGCQSSPPTPTGAGSAPRNDESGKKGDNPALIPPPGYTPPNR